ncbi:hypothetical protein BKA70DRAFT_1443436 [Coprinopsis sp. MPI-PUGE-AT-0042]|nr:hypothetical protein BKA70DRAFT_1443436 [Coprinopsis sp. MPI-PUGE-AT-0042]
MATAPSQAAAVATETGTADGPPPALPPPCWPVEVVQGEPSSPPGFTTKCDNYHGLATKPTSPLTKGYDLSDPNGEAAKAAIHAGFALQCHVSSRGASNAPQAGPSNVAQHSGPSNAGHTHSQPQIPIAGASGNPEQDSNHGYPWRLASTPYSAIAVCWYPTRESLLDSHVRDYVLMALNEPHVIVELHRYCYAGGSQLTLNDVDPRRQWEPYFDLETQNQIRNELILPMVDHLWVTVVRDVMLTTVAYIIQVILTNPALFPDLAGFVRDGPWASPNRLRQALLWYALTGAYLHFFLKGTKADDTDFSTNTEYASHYIAEEAEIVAAAISHQRRLPFSCHEGMMHFRNGGLMLIIRTFIDEIIKKAPNTLAFAVLLNCLSPPLILEVLKLPIALLSATLYACYHEGRVSINAENVLTNTDSADVIVTKFNSAGAFLLNSYRYVHRLEMQWLSHKLFKYFSLYHCPLEEGAIGDLWLTPVPQNTQRLIDNVQQDEPIDASDFSYQAVDRRNKICVIQPDAMFLTIHSQNHSR